MTGGSSQRVRVHNAEHYIGLMHAAEWNDNPSFPPTYDKQQNVPPRHLQRETVPPRHLPNVEGEVERIAKVREGQRQREAYHRQRVEKDLEQRWRTFAERNTAIALTLNDAEGDEATAADRRRGRLLAEWHSKVFRPSQDVIDDKLRRMPVSSIMRRWRERSDAYVGTARERAAAHPKGAVFLETAAANAYDPSAGHSAIHYPVVDASQSPTAGRRAREAVLGPRLPPVSSHPAETTAAVRPCAASCPPQAGMKKCPRKGLESQVAMDHYDIVRGEGARRAAAESTARPSKRTYQWRPTDVLLTLPPPSVMDADS